MLALWATGSCRATSRRTIICVIADSATTRGSTDGVADPSQHGVLQGQHRSRCSPSGSLTTTSAVDVVLIVLAVLSGSSLLQRRQKQQQQGEGGSGPASSSTFADDGHASLDHILIRHKHREASTERARVSKSESSAVCVCVCVEI